MAANGIPLEGFRRGTVRLPLPGNWAHYPHDRAPFPFQHFDQCRPEKSRGAGNQNAHVQGLLAPIHTVRPGRLQCQKNFGNGRFAWFADFDAAEVGEFSFGKLKMAYRVLWKKRCGWISAWSML
jgi:hypothetical protein